AASANLGHAVKRMLDSDTYGAADDHLPRYAVTLLPANGDVTATRKAAIAQTGFSRHKDKGKGKYDGVLVLKADALENGKLTYYGTNVSSLQRMAHLRRRLSKVFTTSRLGRQGVDMATVSRAMQPVRMHA